MRSQTREVREVPSSACGFVGAFRQFPTGRRVHSDQTSPSHPLTPRAAVESIHFPIVGPLLTAERERIDSNVLSKESISFGANCTRAARRATIGWLPVWLGSSGKFTPSTFVML